MEVEVSAPNIMVVGAGAAEVVSVVSMYIEEAFGEGAQADLLEEATKVGDSKPFPD